MRVTKGNSWPMSGSKFRPMSLRRLQELFVCDLELINVEGIQENRPKIALDRCADDTRIFIQKVLKKDSFIRAHQEVAFWGRVSSCDGCSPGS